MSDEKSNDLDAFLDQDSKDAVQDEGTSLLDDLPTDDDQELTGGLSAESDDVSHTQLVV